MEAGFMHKSNDSLAEIEDGFMQGIIAKYTLY